MQREHLLKFSGVKRMEIRYEQLFHKVEPVIANKLEEFAYLGYDTIAAQEIWDYCIEKKWRKRKVETIALHEIVATIFNVSASDIISYSQIQGFREIPLQVGLTQEEMDMLLEVLPSHKK
jgi:hypothetical protein